MIGRKIKRVVGGERSQPTRKKNNKMLELYPEEPPISLRCLYEYLSGGGGGDGGALLLLSAAVRVSVSSLFYGRATHPSSCCHVDEPVVSFFFAFFQQKKCQLRRTQFWKLRDKTVARVVHREGY